MAKVIQLTQGKYALVDDEDFERVSRFTWHFTQKTPRHGYARRAFMRHGKTHTIYLHRFIMEASDKITVDHINHDGLDNRRANLRLANQHQQNGNRLKNRNTKNRYKGVGFVVAVKKWRAKIKVNGKTKCLGCFDAEIDAAKAYNRAAQKAFGEYALLNAFCDPSPTQQ